jgi:hypothetical protein
VNPSTVSYSTLSHSAAASEISRAYTVEGLTSGEFLNRGLNDTFRVRTAGRRFVFASIDKAGGRGPRSDLLQEASSPGDTCCLTFPW